MCLICMSMVCVPIATVICECGVCASVTVPLGMPEGIYVSSIYIVCYSAQGWLLCEPQRFSVASHLSTLKGWDYRYTSHLALNGFWGFELKVSCLDSKILPQ